MTTLADTDVTYEVWEQRRGQDAQRRHERGFTKPGMPQKIADDFTEDQKWLDRYQPEGSEPSTRYFVVKATTTFEEVS